MLNQPASGANRQNAQCRKVRSRVFFPLSSVAIERLMGTRFGSGSGLVLRIKVCGISVAGAHPERGGVHYGLAGSLDI